MRFSIALVITWACVFAHANEKDLYRQDNLVAWCIVPFDAKKRTPQERVEMLSRLGFRQYAYDWRAEHLPSLEQEITLLKAAKIELLAVWFPATLNADAKEILRVLEKTGTKTQLWITMSDPNPTAKSTEAKISAACLQLGPIVSSAVKIGCKVGLYNHGGWFGEPENQIEIIRKLNQQNVGIVYNQHHGHSHIKRFAELLKKMQPYLYCVNLNGMVLQGDEKGLKIVPIAHGDEDLKLLRILQQSEYEGPIGILGHTNEDAEARLLDNLDGLKWIKSILQSGNTGPMVTPRTKVGVRTKR